MGKGDIATYLSARREGTSAVQSPHQLHNHLRVFVRVGLSLANVILPLHSLPQHTSKRSLWI
jgi:hypothetical protein